MRKKSSEKYLVEDELNERCYCSGCGCLIPKHRYICEDCWMIASHFEKSKEE